VPRRRRLSTIAAGARSRELIAGEAAEHNGSSYSTRRDVIGDSVSTGRDALVG